MTTRELYMEKKFEVHTPEEFLREFDVRSDTLAKRIMIKKKIWRNKK